jgi:cyanophycinase-like exopeptidase
VVFVTQATNGNAALNNGTTYTANSDFGVGTSNGAGWYCVYKGTGTNVNVTGLLVNTAYRVMVCEYNGTLGNETYNISTAVGNPANKTPKPSNQALNINISGIFVGKATLAWTRGNGTTCAVFVKQTTSIAELAPPLDNTNYTPNTSFSSGTQIESTGWYCVYTGTGTNVLVTNLTGGETYRVMVCEYNGVTGGEVFNITSASNNPRNFNTITSKTDQTITFNTLAPRQYGSADFDPGATTSSGLTITYSSSNTAVATIVSGKIHIVGMGNTTITASQAGNVDYTPAIPVDQSLTIDMGTQGINFTPLAARYYGDPDFDPGAVASSDLPVTYSSNNPNVAVIVDGKVRIVGVGTTSISAFQPGNSNFYPASSVFQNLTVLKKTQTITFNPIPAKKYGDDDFEPGATSSSGLIVVYTSTNPDVAKIVGGRIRIVGAGATNIRASQPGNSFYNAAPVVPRTLLVDQTNQTITFNPLADIIYDDIYLDPALSTSGLDIEYISDNTSVAEILNNKIHIVGAGTVNITATQPGNNDYNPANDVSQPLTVTKQDQTISFNILPSAIMGDPDITLMAEASSGLPVIYSSDNTSVATIVNSTIHIVGVGSANIIASQPGDNRFNPALSTVLQPFSVDNADQLITFNSLPSKTFGDPDFTLSATASSGLPVTFSSDNPSVATVTGNLVHIVNAGTVNITASQVGDGTYDRAPYVIQGLLIKKASQTITFDVLPAKNLGDADVNLTASSSSGLPVSFVSDNTAVATLVAGKIHIVGAGTANIYAMQAGNTNYNAANSVYQTFTVTKASQTVNFSPIASKTYTDADFNPGATSSTGLPITYSSSNENVAIIVGDKIHIVGLGSSVITATQGGSTNYLPASASQTLNVNKASQTITFNPLASRPYGSPDFNLTATSSSGLDIVYTSSNVTVATVTNGRVHIVGVGSTLIRASQPGDANYNSTLQTQTLIITKTNQTISFAEIPEQVFENGDYLLEAEASSGLPVSFTTNNPSVATINYGWLHIEGAGVVTVTATQTGNSNYFSAQSVSQVLTIRKKSQIIYFDTIPEKTYGDADFDPDAVSSSGLQVNYLSNNPTVATIVNGRIHIVGAGTANITAYQSANSNYYAAENIVKTLVVKKATLVVSVDDKIRKFNTDNPIFTYSLTGFVYADKKTSLDVMPIANSIATKQSYPGSYAIIPQGGSDNNYNFLYNNGVLTILGTSPLKPATPVGNTILCINSADQTYTTAGGVFSTSYVWELQPSSAGKITGTGVNAIVNFNDDYTGKASITVKGKSLELSESSDTLHINILPKLSIPEINCRGSYCDNNIFGDSIIIPVSPAKYKFQLYKNSAPYEAEIEGNDAKIGWYDLKNGTYHVTEMLCDINIKSDIIIKEVSPNSSKPEVSIKWNDVIVCVKGEDSIIGYKWYKDGKLISGENKQFLWTQQKAGQYSVTTTDFSGCDFTSDEVLIESPIAGIVYPNPNHGQFDVSFNSDEKGSVTIKVSSMKSLPVKTLFFNKDSEEFKKEVNIQGVTPGIYFVDVLFNGKRIY